MKGSKDCPQLLNWMNKVRGSEEEEKKLELRLGPPGDHEDWGEVKEKSEGSSVGSLISLGYPTKFAKCTTNLGAKRGFLVSNECKIEGIKQEQQCNFTAKLATSATKETTMTNRNLQTRVSTTSTTPVVGWPPIRSFRKNLASSSTLKSPIDIQKESSETIAKHEKTKNLLVKINMEGIPIGRKVDLKAHDSYEKLSLAVDELFRGLLAVQADPLATEKQKAEEKYSITCLFDGSSEYTLVYEDNEGDKLLVGDVPWEMFVSTAKRLRVLKTSELSLSSLGSVNRKRTANEC